MALITQADLERHLQITIGTDPDSAVAWIIENSQAAVESWCGQELETGARTVTMDPPDAHHLLVLPHGFIHTVTSITEDGTTLVEDEDYLIYQDGRVKRLGGSNQLMQNWLPYPQCVTASYESGFGAGAPAPYGSIPHELRLAITQIAGRAFLMGAEVDADRVGVASITLQGSDSVSFVNPGAIDHGVYAVGDMEKPLLAKYVRRSL